MRAAAACGVKQEEIVEISPVADVQIPRSEVLLSNDSDKSTVFEVKGGDTTAIQATTSTPDKSTNNNLAPYSLRSQVCIEYKDKEEEYKIDHDLLQQAVEIRD